MNRVQMRARKALMTPHRPDSLEKALAWVRAHWDAVCVRHETPLTITLETPRIPCSSSMRNTLHMWFGEIADQTGNELHDVKDHLVREFVGTRMTSLGGRDIEVRRSTEGLRKADYLTLMDRLQAWAVEWDIEITQPDPAMRAGWMREIERERRREEAEAA